MEEAGERPGPEAEAVESALGRLLPVLTAGMPPDEAAKGRETLSALFTLDAARLGPAGLGKEAAARMEKAEGLPLDGRRRMLQEDALALEVKRISGQVSGTALGLFRGEVQLTGAMKKETRRTLARLGQLNAALVGRFPNRTDLIEEVSDSYLDAMLILGGGHGPLSTRLARAAKEGEAAGKGG
jgi:hypothetical protein